MISVGVSRSYFPVKVGIQHFELFMNFFSTEFDKTCTKRPAVRTDRLTNLLVLDPIRFKHCLETFQTFSRKRKAYSTFQSQLLGEIIQKTVHAR